tara:strand:- start:41 stop:223 length:183 start_codon:yes stop_codon:yes gene_type:complete
MLFDIKVQQSLSRLLNKTQLNLNGDNSLEGLNIDWHMAEYDYSAAPISRKADVQPTYAFA